MKRFLLVLLVGATSAAPLAAQQFSKFTPYEQLTLEQRKKGQNHMSPQALNILFNNQISTFLSSSGDLVLNKTYALLSSSDSELVLGGTFKRKNQKGDFVRYVNQFGVKLKAKDDFAQIFSSEDGFSGSAGVFWKGTFFRKGTIKFGTEYQKQIRKSTVEADLATPNSYIIAIQKMENYLEAEYQVLYLEEKAKIDKTVARLGTNWTAQEKADEAKKRVDMKLLDLTKEYMKDVQANLLREQYLTKTTKSWTSLEIFVPITATEYVVSENNLDTDFDTLMHRPFEGRLSFNYLETRKKGSRLFLSFSPGIAYHNSITRDELSKTSFKSFVSRDTADETIGLTQIGNNEVYVGDIDEGLLVPTVNGNATWMFGGKMKFIGVSAALEYREAAKKLWLWKWGVPLNLAGKDEKTKVNFELQFKFNSITKEQITGISVGLPFGETVY